MDYVYELIKNINVRGVIFTESVDLFSKKEKAIEAKENLEKYNPNETYDIFYRRVN